MALFFAIAGLSALWFWAGWRCGRSWERHRLVPVKVNIVSPDWVDAHICIGCKNTLKAWVRNDPGRK